MAIRIALGEKMTLLESRLGQTERRIEREMTQIHGKMEDVFRNLPDKSYVLKLTVYPTPGTFNLKQHPSLLPITLPVPIP